MFSNSLNNPQNGTSRILKIFTKIHPLDVQTTILPQKTFETASNLRKWISKVLLEAIRGCKSSQIAKICWGMRCVCSGRLKKVHHEGFYFVKHCDLHWRTIWPLMNPLNNIPFWGPQAMSNAVLVSNLKKKIRNYIF